MLGGSTNDHGFSAPFGVIQLLDRGEECVKIHEQYRTALPCLLYYRRILVRHALIVAMQRYNTEEQKFEGR